MKKCLEQLPNLYSRQFFNLFYLFVYGTQFTDHINIWPSDTSARQVDLSCHVTLAESKFHEPNCQGLPHWNCYFPALVRLGSLHLTTLNWKVCYNQIIQNVNLKLKYWPNCDAPQRCNWCIDCWVMIEMSYNVCFWGLD